MKKIISAAALIALSACLYGSSDAETEMVRSYYSGFYPGVVKFADRILEENSGSVNAGKALIYKGESLFRMGMITESLETLDAAALYTRTNSELESKRCYWIGRGFVSLKKNEQAVPYFVNSLNKASSTQKKKDSVYFPAVLAAGRCYKNLSDFKNALPFFVCVAGSGSQYSVLDWEDAVVSLFECAEKLNQNQLVNQYYQKLKDKPLTVFTRYRIQLIYGDSLLNQEDFSGSYKVYCDVLSSAPAALAAVAMQKAYSVSSEHYQQVKEEPGAIIEKAESRLSEYPALVSEFWTRLAADSFNQKNYEKSLQYFEKASKDADAKLLQIKCLYSAEIAFLTSKKAVKESAQQAENILQKGIETFAVDENSALAGVFYSGLSRYCAYSQKYDESEKLALKVLSLNVEESIKKSAAYWYAYSLYQKGQFEKAVLFLSETNLEKDNDILFLEAKALARSGKSSDADKIFYSLAEKGELNNDGRLDYVRTLLNAGHLISTEQQASLATGSEAIYMKALAAFNRQKWEESGLLFEKVLSGSGLDPKYVNYARFYLGYCQYQTGKYVKAYDTFYAFTSADSLHPLAWNAYVTGSRCASLAGKLSEAVLMAGKAVTSSKNDDQKQEAVLLLAGIYTDSRNYDNAIKTLSPYMNARNEFGYQCKFLAAQVYVQNGDFVQADKAYASLASEKAAPEKEEALYRRGELAWSQENYSQAIELFEEYNSKYADGNFYYGSMYFAAESLVKTGRSGRAILYYEQIISSPASATYRYGAYRQLMELNAQNQDYSKAVAFGQKLVEEYGKQAADDGIQEKIQEYKALNKGESSKNLELEKAFVQKGSEKTPAGRKAGTELVKNYLLSSETEAAGETLALKLLELQKSQEAETMYAAENCLSLAVLYRNRSDCEKAGKYYLDGAEFSRKCGNDLQSQRSLYGAVEAYDAAGKISDSREIADLLSKLYPESEYDRLARKIVNR